MAGPDRDPTAAILAELDELGYVPGMVVGEHKDPGLLWVPVMGMEDARFGRLCRAMGDVTSRFVQAEHTAHQPPMLDHGAASDEQFDAHRKELARFHESMRTLKVFTGDKLREMITYSSITSDYPALYSKTAIFRVDEPVLYFEHWGTEDLDEPGRDPVEIQMFVGLNGYTQSLIGNVTAHNVLRSLVGDHGISRSAVPDRLKTLGTVNQLVFDPFIIPSEEAK
jgi:hypothetical protein